MTNELPSRELNKLGATSFLWPADVLWPQSVLSSLAVHPEIQIQTVADPFGIGATHLCGLIIRRAKEMVTLDAEDVGRVQLTAGPIGANWSLFKLVADTVLSLGAKPLDNALARYEATIHRWK